MPLTLDQLRRTCDEAEGLPADVAAQVLEDFARYVRNGGRITLDQAFGLCGPSGCTPWYEKLALERLYVVLRDLAEELCPGGSNAEKSDALRLRIIRYRPTWNRRDQHLQQSTATDSVSRLLFAVFRAADGDVPDSPSHLRKILADASI